MLDFYFTIFFCFVVYSLQYKQKQNIACFPLHDRAKSQALGIEWKAFPRRQLPLYYIKEYFGEKIAVYFSFMQHFVTALTVPAFVGLPIQIAVWATHNYSGKSYMNLMISI